MKIRLVFLLLVVLTFFSGTPIPENNKAKVYFTKDISAKGIMKVFEPFTELVKGKVAMKVHFGEEGNKNYLSPVLMKELVQKQNATFVETNVLYVSKRRYTNSHIELAKEHGFDYAPIDILDSEGEKVIPVNLKNYKTIKVGSHIDNYNTFIILSHFKGHGSAGFGGAIKNLSMGFASVAGKMAMHATSIPEYDSKKCIGCGACLRECPAGAITLDPLKIDSSKCIGCAKCIGTCPARAFGVPWKSTQQDIFLERLVEYAKGVSDGRNMIYINVLANISRSCDCAKNAPKPFMEDIGILASTDLVAIEKASHDLIDKAHKCEDAFAKEVGVSGKKQIEYAFKLGMGSTEYDIINLDSLK